MHIRLATPEDAAGVREVYKPYILTTSITFEYDVPSVEDFAERIRKTTATHPWLVCEDQGTIVGYAYGTRHRDRTAYQWSAESTVYLSEAYHRRGIARALYQALFGILRIQGYVNVFAGITQPNPASQRLHESMGFQMIGSFTKIGFKFGKWYDVNWLQMVLCEYPDNPPEPKALREILDAEEFKAIFANANP